MATHGVVSADSHLDLGYLPKDTFTSRAPAQWRAKVPRVVESPDGGQWVAGERGEYKLGQWGGSLRDNARGRRMRASGFVLDEHRPYRINLRLADQDKDGVDAEVIYGIPFLAEMIKDRDTAAVSIAAYNDLVAEWAKAAPSRLYPQALLPGNSVEAAVAEVKRIAGLGLTGAEWDYLVTYKPVWHPYWEPLWAAAAEHRIIISMHVPMFATTTVGKLPHLDPHPASEAAWLSVLPMQIDEALASVIFSGVLERYPALKVVMTESGIGWIPYLLDRMDYEWEEHYDTMDWKSLIRTRPSDLFRAHIYATFQKDNVGPLLAERFCPDNFMFGSDYPHPDGVWPDSHAVINATLGGLSDTLRKKIVNDNARALYHMLP